MSNKSLRLCIQDPSYKDSMYLHESLLTACESSIAGGGAYAFATKDGIELFLEDESFRNFIEAGQFYLIVGMDDITNMRALQSLKAFEERYKGHLVVKAYVHNNRGSTFHPKYSWFQNIEGGTLIIGSGNLTQKGLRYNREAFGVVNCDEASIKEVLNEWNSWIAHSQPFLFDVDDAIVLALAEENAANNRAMVRARQAVKQEQQIPSTIALAELFNTQPKDALKKTSDTDKNKKAPDAEEARVAAEQQIEEFDEDEAYWEISLDSSVLIAEIPRSGNRWKQVNFDKNTFENYFGATCGENGAYRVLLKSIDREGVMGETEVRPSVSVSSHNYRFELDAASGINYPSDGNRPLGVFAKVSQRDFLYELVMPGDAGYDSLKMVLNEREPASAKMRRLTYYCREVAERTPELGLWKRIGETTDDK